MQRIRAILSNYFTDIRIPSIRWTDIVEIIVLAVLVYYLMLWIRKTRAYAMLRMLLVVFVFVIIAALFNMTTIMWVVQNVASVAILAIVVILQPELRHGLMELGQRNWLGNILQLGVSDSGRFSDRTINEIVRACAEMAKVRTGALIVVEQEIPLTEFEDTGIEVDAVVSSQLLINIFEKNTPLHDGAVIIRGDRVVSATCYLPLSERPIDKDLGTRHRAALGMAESSDALVIVVSEETGHISLAYRGELDRDVDAGTLKAALVKIQNKSEQDQGRRGIFRFFARKEKNGEKNN
ncbi:MAG: diadenylate cyclase CdaA [Lachnospiraceae bacterium]|nr:diadenylate cyclase CdaA [Lachnospiraceae bacterium]